MFVLSCVSKAYSDLLIPFTSVSHSFSNKFDSNPLWVAVWFYTGPFGVYLSARLPEEYVIVFPPSLCHSLPFCCPSVCVRSPLSLSGWRWSGAAGCHSFGCARHYPLLVDILYCTSIHISLSLLLALPLRLPLPTLSLPEIPVCGSALVVVGVSTSPSFSACLRLFLREGNNSEGNISRKYALPHKNEFRHSHMD